MTRREMIVKIIEKLTGASNMILRCVLAFLE